MCYIVEEILFQEVYTDTETIAQGICRYNI